MKKNGFNESLIYTPNPNSNDNTSNKQRKCKLIWFDPIFSLIAEINVDMTFLKLLKWHFPEASKMHKISNEKIVKES